MNYIYIGSNHRGYGLHQFTLYTEKPEKLIETLKRKIPAIERLFVSIDKFEEAEKDLTKPESLIYAACRQVKEAK